MQAKDKPERDEAENYERMEPCFVESSVSATESARGANRRRRSTMLIPKANRVEVYKYLMQGALP